MEQFSESSTRFAPAPSRMIRKKFGIQRGHGIATPLARLSGAMHGAIALFIQSQKKTLADTQGFLDY